MTTALWFRFSGGSMGLFLHLLVDQNTEFPHHILQLTAKPLHFRDIHNTRGLFLLRLGKGCADLCAFFLGNILKAGYQMGY